MTRLCAATRWARFMAVGAGGFVLQLTLVSLLSRTTALPVSVCVAVAVAVTLSHNFFWHERVTWPGLGVKGRGRRWVAFHATNGLTSLGTNVIATGPIMAVSGLPVEAANAIAVGMASLVNFIASDRFVFVNWGSANFGVSSPPAAPPTR